MYGTRRHAAAAQCGLLTYCIQSSQRLNFKGCEGILVKKTVQELDKNERNVAIISTNLSQKKKNNNKIGVANDGSKVFMQTYLILLYH